MKKLFLLALVALISVGATCATLETKTGYVRNNSTDENGLAYVLTYLVSVYDNKDAFVKYLGLGLYTDLSLFENGKYNFVAAPIVKMTTKLIYVKGGLGWDYNKVNGVSDNSYAVISGAGFTLPLSDKADIALDWTFKYNLNNSTYTNIVGPVFAIKL